MGERFYVSTPIYYVNDQPHIGHLYTTTLADVAARSRRLAGRDVFFLTGTDEHAAKVETAAQERGLSTRAWADRNAQAFRETFADFGIANDDFLRTSEPRHCAFVGAAIEALESSGDLYLGRYEGWYDANQEEFVSAGRAEECNYRSPITGKALVRRSEENFFFRLSRYAEPLLRHLEDHPDFVQPRARRNEVIARVRSGIDDVPVSRPAGGAWGVRFPRHPEHLVYVWIDALLNYTSAVATPERRAYWPADLHLIAKDILWFHAVIWPALLMALQRSPEFRWLVLPRGVYAHSFWIREGQKMSKTLGNFVDLQQLVATRERFGLDALRYFLVSQGPLGTGDSDFAMSRFTEVYNADLAHAVGNSLSRIAHMVQRYLGGRFERGAEGGPLRAEVEALLAEPDTHPLGLGGIARGVDAVRRIDRYIETTQPFRLARQAGTRERVAALLYECAEAFRIASLLLWPAMPGTMEEVWRRLGVDDYGATLAHRGRGRGAAWLRWGGIAPGTSIASGPPLFPRDVDEEPPAAGASTR